MPRGRSESHIHRRTSRFISECCCLGRAGIHSRPVSLWRDSNESSRLLSRVNVGAERIDAGGGTPRVLLPAPVGDCRGIHRRGRLSGSKESRPALNRLLADAKRRKFDAVLVYRYDRFARSLRHLVNALAEFDALGIHFVSLHEGVDTSTPNGRLVFGIFASIAEFERELIRGRVRSGLAAAKARGKRLGRPTVTVDTARIAALRASAPRRLLARHR